MGRLLLLQDVTPEEGAQPGAEVEEAELEGGRTGTPSRPSLAA